MLVQEWDGLEVVHLVEELETKRTIPAVQGLECPECGATGWRILMAVRNAGLRIALTCAGCNGTYTPTLVD
jgi:hypothetical protein